VNQPSQQAAAQAAAAATGTLANGAISASTSSQSPQNENGNAKKRSLMPRGSSSSNYYSPGVLSSSLNPLSGSASKLIQKVNENQIQAFLSGEVHNQIPTFQDELAWATFFHDKLGGKTVVIEFPSELQAEVSQLVRDPSYENMGRFQLAWQAAAAGTPPNKITAPEMATFAPLNAALYRAADHGDKEGVARAAMALDAAYRSPLPPLTEQKKETSFANARAQVAM
jgi:hypothetical protein